MGLFGKKKKVELEKEESSKVLEGEDKSAKKKSSKKKVKSEGSRWTALVLLLITIILGLMFYLKGEGWGDMSGSIGGWFDNFGGESTFVLE